MPGAADAQIVAAAKAAFAHDFIVSFPLGYDTEVGEFGSQLSLGQRRRIAIARALIKNAPIILLDEPTASLDSEPEQKLQEALCSLCAGKTTLVIAHRLNTITHADCIHVVEHGMIVESGRHDVLMRKGGRYTTFFRLQFPGDNVSVAAAGLEAQVSTPNARCALV
jgi:ATP-binding cassette, subfamily B, bacterial MsbA